MTSPEPKCIQWKRRGAERVAAQIANMPQEQELEFWREKTERLRVRQVQQRQAEGLGEQGPGSITNPENNSPDH